MLSLLLLAILPKVGQQPSPWESVMGMNLVEYRWSRPAANSCLIEFRSIGAAAPARFDAKTRFVTNRPMSPVDPTGPGRKKDNVTVVKEQTDERQQSIHLLSAGTASEAISGCYRVVVVQAAASGAKPAEQAN